MQVPMHVEGKLSANEMVMVFAAVVEEVEARS